VILRLSKKLGDRLKVKHLQPLPLEPDRFLDFTATSFTAGRLQYVLFINTYTLYGVVIPARGLTSPHSLTCTALWEFGEVLALDGLRDAYVLRQQQRSFPVRFATQLDRALIGSVNDMILHAKYVLSDAALTHYRQATGRLNDLPMSVLWKRGKSSPAGAMKELIDGTPPPTSPVEC
jgi:hypothetical protein